jgi:hypothetical protein
MSHRQSLQAQMRRTNYRFATPTITNRKAIVVKITWTTAAVVKTTIRRDFKLQVYGIDVKVGDIVQHATVQFRAGQTIYFTRAETPGLARQGYYYITVEDDETIEGAPIGIGCTCVAGLTFDQHCTHQDRIHAHTYRGLLQEQEQAHATGDTVLAEAYGVLAAAYGKEASACCTHIHPLALL